MATMPFLESVARDVLSHFPVARRIRDVTAVRPGFSGACVCRVTLDDGPVVCLRAWPGGVDLQQARFCHRLMQQAHAAGLEFVPRLFPATDGKTTLYHAGTVWEVQEWMPGKADFHASPTCPRLLAVSSALARLHTVWTEAGPVTTGLCPAIARRVNILDSWQQAQQAGWRLPDHLADLDPIHPIARQACRAVQLLAGWARQSLRWNETCTLQPCLCDPWHDNFLFTGDQLTGLIDYAAARIDHPAVDLGRMLGSLVEDDVEAWELGLAAYGRVRPFSVRDMELVRILDRTGIIAAAANWLLRIYRDAELVGDRAAVARRLEKLVQRMERWL